MKIVRKCLGLIFVVVFAINSVSFGAMKNKTILSLERYVQNEIDFFIESGESIVTWDETTKISDTIELYSLNDVVTGYIVHLKTGDEETGFMQIQIVENSFVTLNLGFAGEDYLTGYLENNGIFTSELNRGRVYYTGNFDYFFKNASGELIDLSNQELLTDEMIPVLQRKTMEYERLMEISSESVMTGIEPRATTATLVCVQNLTASTPYLRSMAYYSGYANHCAPTAATNLALYWGHSRGCTNFLNGSDPFPYFVSRMGTTIGGTPLSYTHDSIYGYFRTHYQNVFAVGTINPVSYSTLKSYINIDYALYLHVQDWSGTVDHAINVWGYMEGSSVDYIYVTTNQDRGTTAICSLINFNAYSYLYYVYTEITGY